MALLLKPEMCITNYDMNENFLKNPLHFQFLGRVKNERRVKSKAVFFSCDVFHSPRIFYLALSPTNKLIEIQIIRDIPVLELICGGD